MGASAAFMEYIGYGSEKSVTSQLSQAEGFWHYYNHHPWVGSAVSLIGNAIVGDGYQVLAPGNDRDQSAVNDDPVVQAVKLVLDQINDAQSLTDLVQEVAMDMDVVGKAYLFKLRLPGNKQVVGLERLDSRTTVPVVSDDGKSIGKFVQKENINGKEVVTTFQPNEIIFFKLPGGSPLTGGKSPMDKLDLTLAVDWSSRKHNAAYFRNGCKAGQVLINKKSTAEQLEQNKKTMALTKVGPDNAYKPLWLAGDWDVHLPATTDDEEHGKTMDRARQEVCAVYHIPESKLMTTEGTLGGNGKEADDQTFHEECVMPRAQRIYGILTRELLCKEWGLTDLAVAPKAKYSIRPSMVDTAVKLLQMGGTINESRSIVNLPDSAFKGANLDAPLIATTVAAYHDPVDPIAMAEATAKAHASAFGPPGQPINQPAPEPKDKPPPGSAKKALAVARQFRLSRRSTALPNDSSAVTTANSPIS